jgi:CheY-like chemotaxis protein
MNRQLAEGSIMVTDGNSRWPRTAERSTGLRILLVEADPDTVDSTTMLLCLEGHQVRVAPDGPSALEEVRYDSPDVAVLDIALPGTDGWQLAEHFSGGALLKRPFLIALTRDGRPADRRRSEEAGIHLHLVKPVDPQYLLGVLRRFQAILSPSQSSQLPCGLC